jgi:hypothetical protein
MEHVGAKMTAERLSCAFQVGNPSTQVALVGMERDRMPDDLKAVLKGIGAELRKQHSDMLHDKVPDGIAELLKQLDQPSKDS